MNCELNDKLSKDTTDVANLDEELKTERQNEEVSHFAAPNSNLTKQVKKHNLDLIESKETDKYEVNAIKNLFKAKIKYWRKELGGETENKIKVETKLEVLSKTKNEAQSKIEIEDIPILVTVIDVHYFSESVNESLMRPGWR